jgi:hypothetical protein
MNRKANKTTKSLTNKETCYPGWELTEFLDDLSPNHMQNKIKHYYKITNFNKYSLVLCSHKCFTLICTLIIIIIISQFS